MNSTLQECVIPQLVKFKNESDSSFAHRRSYRNETQPWCIKSYWYKPKNLEEAGFKSAPWTGDVTNRGCSFAKQGYPLPEGENLKAGQDYEHYQKIEFWHKTKTHYYTNYCKEDGCNGYAHLKKESPVICQMQLLKMKIMLP